MNSIYLVLDMQNDLVHADGANGKTALGEQVAGRGVVENTARAIAGARAAGVPVAFVRVGFSENYEECPAGSPLFSGAPKAGLFRLGTWGTEIHPGLGMRPEDPLITKHRVSPFYATTLEPLLSARRIGRIYCSGVSTQAVVQAAVRDGHDRDFEMIVVEDGCAAASLEEHRNSLQSLARFCRVETLESVLKQFGSPPA